MFSRARVVRLSETDATGVLYFTNTFKYATEVFEEFLGNRIQEGDYLLPVVSAKATFLKPLFVADQIELCLSLNKTGATSIELHTKIYKNGELIGNVEMIHVVTSKSTLKKIQIPMALQEYLLSLGL